MQPLLSFSDVCYAYHTLKGEIPAIRNITFSLPKQEFLAVIGPSGCGKSTLLNLTAGLLQPDSGQILYKGSPLSSCGFSPGYMLQKDHLLGWRSVLDNILLGPGSAEKTLRNPGKMHCKCWKNTSWRNTPALIPTSSPEVCVSVWH